MIEMDVEAKRKPVALSEDEPAHYLVLGDFGGHSQDAAVKLHSVDRDNFDAVLQSLDVQLAGVQFRELEDFHPDRLFQRLPLFREFDLAPPLQNGAPHESPTVKLGEIIKTSSLLEQIAEGGDPFALYVQELARAHAAPKEATDPQRDAALGERMRGLLHHPRFQAIEAAWRGLDFVIRFGDSDAAAGARVRIAHFPREEAARDLLDTENLRDTRMRDLLGRQKWRAVIGLYTFGAGAADIEFLGRMALLAAHAGVPFIAEGSPDMGAHWEELKSIPEASHLGLALPRFLLRLPYGARTSPIETFPFEEMAASPAHAHYLWGNPALACLALLMAGGQALNLEGLPLHTYQEGGEWKSTPCAEVYMTESQALALMDLGLMPLVSYRESDKVRLAGFRAVNGKALAVVA